MGNVAGDSAPHSPWVEVVVLVGGEVLHGDNLPPGLLREEIEHLGGGSVEASPMRMRPISTAHCVRTSAAKASTSGGTRLARTSQTAMTGSAAS